MKIKQMLSAALSRSRTTAGFTMIELLVVIAVIGVLAVAVLSSINPIEQINKGRDTRIRADAYQLIEASNRYFAIHEAYPWDEDGTPSTPAQAYTHPNGEFGWLDLLVDTAEVKQGFTNRVSQDAELRLFKAAGENATLYACYIPRSLAFKTEARDNCQDDTTPDGGTAEVPNGAIDPCVGTDIEDDNYLCLP